MDVDPPQYMKPSIAGLKKFIEEVQNSANEKFRFILNFSGTALVHLKNKEREIINILRDFIDSGKIMIGNHTLTHKDLLGETKPFILRLLRFQFKPRPLSQSDLENEIIKCSNYIIDVFDVEPTIFKAPYYRINSDILNFLTLVGFKYDLSIYGTDKKPVIERIDEREIIRIPSNFRLSSSFEWPKDMMKYPGKANREWTIIVSSTFEFAKRYVEREKVMNTFNELLKDDEIEWLLPEDVEAILRE